MKPKKTFKPIEKFAKLDKDSSVVFDLGAWNGQFTSFFAERALAVIAVEPDYENFWTLLQRIVTENLTNVFPVFSAIGLMDTSSGLYLAKSWQHSLLMKDTFDHNVSQRRVPVICWDTLVESLGITEVDFAKINIEGAEEMLFTGMTKVFPKKVVIEEHSSHGLGDIAIMQGILASKGYEIIKIDGVDIYAEFKCNNN